MENLQWYRFETYVRDEIPSVREYNPAIPQSVENIIIKATAKNTNNRYQCADDMLDDLEICLERLDEPKLSFDQVNNDPTIIATDSQFFTKTAPLDLEETKTEIEEIEPEEEKIKEPMDKKKNCDRCGHWRSYRMSCDCSRLLLI